MTGDELNELNEGLPWWVKKKIIDSRRQSHPPAPPPPPAPPRYPCSIAEPQSPRNVSKDFVGLLPPKVQPVGSWMKGNILFCHGLVMWLNTWEEHPDFSSTVVQRCCELKSIECLGRVWNHFRGLYDEFPNLIHVNTHFHLGGEHQNVDEGGYSLNYTDAGLAGNIVPNDIRPGYFCRNQKWVTTGPWLITTGHLAKMWRWATPMSFTGSIPRPGPLMGFCRAAWVVSSIDP